MSSNIFIQTLRYLKVNYTARFSEEFYSTFPNKDNMLGLSKMLNEYGIDAFCGLVENKEAINADQSPFIAHLGDRFALVKLIQQNKVVFFDDNSKRDIKSSKSEFIEMWTGYVISLSVKDNAGEPNYSDHLIKQYYERGLLSSLAFFSLILFVTEMLNNTSFGFSSYAILLLSILGLILSLTLTSLNTKMSDIASHVCDIFGSNQCSQKIRVEFFHRDLDFELSQFALGFFFANVFLIVYFNGYIQQVFLINILTMFVSAFSIIYQSFVLKKWCPICLGILIILLCLQIISLTHIDWSTAYNSDSLLFTSINYALFIVGTAYFFMIRRSNKSYVNTKYQLNSIKSDYDIFNVLLLKQRRYNNANLVSNIIIGSPEAKHQIVFVSNPQFRHCSETLKELIYLCQRSPDFSIKFIFAPLGHTYDNVARFLIALYKNNSSQFIDFFLSYTRGEIEIDYNNHSMSAMNINDFNVTQEIERHKQSIYSSKISQIPIVIFDGYELPETYSINDLRIILTS